jgi:hypothetical protein
MENTKSFQGDKPKRYRTDRLIGFRLDPADYETLTRLVSRNTISISAYMRQLVQSDAQRIGHRVETK